LIVQEIWDSIETEQVHLELTELQKKELDDRINDYDLNPENILTWEEVKASIKKQ
jgi:putative addiction module component (TIGR02574 family)